MKSITEENIPSSDQKVEKHMKVIECPILVRGRKRVTGEYIEASRTLTPINKKKGNLSKIKFTIQH